MIGEIFDKKYKIERLIGEGGMGAVYEAVDQGSSEHVAIKLISANVAKNANLVARFHREAKALAAIATEDIVQVRETGTDPASGLPYMVMEYLEGEDLAHLFKRLGPLPVELALRLGAQSCITLQKAHEARVIHRDIKPANLFLAKLKDGERKVKLLDFGVAKIKLETVGVDTSGLTRTGSMLGSPLYMSPEQARGQKVIDSRADIWSLGVVLYQALTGKRPHQDIDGLGELIIAICSELPTPVQELAPWVPESVAKIVHGALQFAPEDRFQTATSMLDAITAELKDGYAVKDEMLVPLPAEQKSIVMPKLASIEMTASASRTVVRSSQYPVDDAAKTVAFDAPTDADKPKTGAAPTPADRAQAKTVDERALAKAAAATDTSKVKKQEQAAETARTPAPPSSLNLLWIALGVLLVVAAAAFAVREMNKPHRAPQGQEQR